MKSRLVKIEEKIELFMTDADIYDRVCDCFMDNRQYTNTAVKRLWANFNEPHFPPALNRIVRRVSPSFENIVSCLNVSQGGNRFTRW